MSPIDPRQMPVTVEDRQADRFAALERRLAVLERTSLNVPGILAQAELQANRDAAWQPAALVGGFANVTGAAPAAYYKDTFGRVYVRGRVSVPGSTPYGATIFTLATGYRPLYEHDFQALAGSVEDIPNWATIRVAPSGAVTLLYGGTIEQVPLDAVQFRTV
jgi:hypothetical protein